MCFVVQRTVVAGLNDLSRPNVEVDDGEEIPSNFSLSSIVEWRSYRSHYVFSLSVCLSVCLVCTGSEVPNSMTKMHRPRCGKIYRNRRHH